jgi:hypothetical protein
MIIKDFTPYSISALNNIIRNLEDVVFGNHQIEDGERDAASQVCLMAKKELAVKIELANSPNSLFSRHYNSDK